LFFLVVDSLDHASGQHDLLAEDPWARIDDDVALSHAIGGLVDLADRAVHGFDAIPGEIASGGGIVPKLQIRAIDPDVIGLHGHSFLVGDRCLPSRPSIKRVRSAGVAVAPSPVAMAPSAARRW